MVLHNAVGAPNTTNDVTLRFADLHWETMDPSKNITLAATRYKIRDLWQHKDLGTFQDNYTAHAIAGHDSVTLKLEPVQRRPLAQPPSRLFA